MLILISDPFDPGLPGRLRRFGEVTDDPARLAEAEVVLVRSKTKCTREYIDRARKLRYIIRGGVGLDNIDLEYAREKGIRVDNTAAASSVAVAELALAMLLALPNHLVRAHQSLQKGQWLKKELKRRELYGKTLGIIGCGRIGREVAKRAAAFGMTVLGYDVVPVEDPVIRPVPLPELLQRSDFVSLHTPLTRATEGMIRAETLAQMKDGAYLVNTGRGACVVEEDVAAALRSGKLAGYATDVWLSDPPDPESPLLKAPNTLLLPHIGASTRENLLRIGDRIVELLEAYTGGRS